ncbi:MAG: glycosyltransferase family 2 protein [Elusimicrobia bacterium]|nr:glycosyltransferase family 2 protein [Elusimicrobiota bacterium]
MEQGTAFGPAHRGTLSVIVPVYSLDSYLAEMLDRLFLSGLRLHAGRPVELVIVDDASPLETETAASATEAAHWAKVVYHRNKENLGYVRSVNKGLSLATGENLLLCNSDTRLAPGALARLEAALDAGPGFGLAGPVSNGGYGALQQAAGAPPPLETFEEAELRRFDAFGLALSGRGLPPVEAGWLVGFCMLLRREVYEELGPLDEGFGFGYLEEVDYAIRARKAGWKLVVAPDAFVFHGGLRKSFQPTGPNAGSQTARAMPVRTTLRILRGMLRLTRKYGWKAVSMPQDAAGTAARGF